MKRLAALLLLVAACGGAAAPRRPRTGSNAPSTEPPPSSGCARSSGPPAATSSSPSEARAAASGGCVVDPGRAGRDGRRRRRGGDGDDRRQGPDRGLDRRRPLPPAGAGAMSRSDPHRRRDARRRGRGDRRRNSGRDADGAGRGRRRRGDLALRRPAAGPGPVRARQQWRRRLCHRPAPAPSAGAKVRVAALAEPRSPEAQAARAALGRAGRDPRRGARRRRCWSTPCSAPASRGRSTRRCAQRLGALAGAARVRVAIDLPSGVATDDGAILSPVPDFDLTITFATLKPSHLLQPAARHMGRIVVADIGIEAESRLAARSAGRGSRAPGPDDHKYQPRLCRRASAGEMPGAAALAAAAARCGPAPAMSGSSATTAVAGLPRAVVQSRPALACAARRPAIGRRGRRARARPVDEDARTALPRSSPARTPAGARRRRADPPGEDGPASCSAAPAPILTPHAGEFARLFGELRAAARSSGARGRGREPGR